MNSLDIHYLKLNFVSYFDIRIYFVFSSIAPDVFINSFAFFISIFLYFAKFECRNPKQY